MQKGRAAPKKAKQRLSTALALPKLSKGEIYKGLIVSERGKPLRHLIELKGDFGSATWDKARETAKAGYALPDRREGALLRASDARGQTGWFWTSEQYEADSGCAWAQYFCYGNQYYSHKVSECRVRLVRSVIC